MRLGMLARALTQRAFRNASVRAELDASTNDNRGAAHASPAIKVLVTLVLSVLLVVAMPEALSHDRCGNAKRTIAETPLWELGVSGT